MHYRSKNSGLLIFRDKGADGREYWQLYDGAGRSIFTFFDYIATRVTKDESAATEIEAEAYSLKLWFEYLETVGIDQKEAQDKDLRSFRDHLIARRTKNSKDNGLARRRSINYNLRVVYQFYAWLQRNRIGGGNLDLLGVSGCKITSSLLESSANMTRATRRYPLLFRNSGSSSKHKVMHVPSAADRDAMTDYFVANQEPAVSERNALLMDIAAQTGLRRASILSLKTSQFSLPLLDTHSRSSRPYLVSPAVQKFSYGNQFEFSAVLVVRIVNYIETSRAAIVRATGSDSDYLFLSSRSGLPLTAKATSNIYARAARALSMPKDSGLHGYRRLFANDYQQSVYEASLEAGGDTSVEMLSAMTASALGHISTRSQEAYLRDMLRRFKTTEAFGRREEIARLRDEIARLRAELAEAVARKR